MVLRKISRILMACGALLMAFGASAMPVQGAEQARGQAAPLLAPSPRPTLAPTARPHGNSKSGGGMGRITGTIIDLSTGAPVTGIKVNIGGTIVSSDANGNYDLWVAAGPYAVALVLAANQGEAAQGQQMVDVGAGATVILHLSFRSPPAPKPTPATSNSAPAAPVEPAAPPAASVASGSSSSAPRPHASPRLPRTAEDSSGPWLWIELGALLLFGGLALEFARKRFQVQFATIAARAARFAPGYENARLLAALLAKGSSTAQPRSTHNEILLAALLTTETGESDSNRQP